MALRSAIEEVDTTVAILKEQRDARRQTPTSTPQNELLTLANAVDEHRLAKRDADSNAHRRDRPGHRRADLSR
jgi:hypothetical protein